MEICYYCRDTLTQDNLYGLHIHCYKKWFKLPDVFHFENLERKNIPSKEAAQNLTLTSPTLGTFFHGNYKKYAGTLNGEHFILKVLEEKYPELPDVEYICNQVAAELGVNVPDFYLVNLHGEKAFITKNFIRATGSSMTLSHLHHHIKDNSEYSIEGLLKIIETTTQRYVDIKQFVYTCLYDVIIGNSDRHLRNLGFIVTAKGTTLSPTYDNPSILGNESGDFLKMSFSPKGAIPTQSTKEPSIKDYVQEFKRLDHQDLVVEFYNNMNKEKILHIIANGFYTPLMKTALTTLVIKRIQEFTDEINA